MMINLVFNLDNLVQIKLGSNQKLGQRDACLINSSRYSRSTQALFFSFSLEAKSKVIGPSFALAISSLNNSGLFWSSAR